MSTILDGSLNHLAHAELISAVLLVSACAFNVLGVKVRAPPLSFASDEAETKLTDVAT